MNEKEVNEIVSKSISLREQLETMTAKYQQLEKSFAEEVSKRVVKETAYLNDVINDLKKRQELIDLELKKQTTLVNFYEGFVAETTGMIQSITSCLNIVRTELNERIKHEENDQTR